MSAINSLKIILFGLVGLLATSASAQETENLSVSQAPYKLAIPDGWTSEKFPVPISFAPAIKYKGIEDIRFAPGWGKKEGDDYWSYAFLWYLDGKILINENTIEKNLCAYYTGLIAANSAAVSDGKLVPVNVLFHKILTESGDIGTFSGTINMFDYMQEKRIVLNCKVHWRSCLEEDKTVIFYELSPKPLSHNIWLSLDGLWVDFECN